MTFSPLSPAGDHSQSDNRITLSNQAAESILGKTKLELIGSKLEQVSVLSDARLAKALAEVQRTNRQIVGLELTHTSSQNPNLALSFNLSPLKDANQTTRGVAIVLEDLTETRRLESLSQLFERMVSPAVIEQLNPNEHSWVENELRSPRSSPISAASPKLSARRS
jgi:PAS domain S-box-containing protein